MKKALLFFAIVITNLLVANTSSAQRYFEEVFTNTMKTKHIVTYVSTTLAIMIMLAIYGFIQGNLKPELFVYAFVMSIAFAI